MESIDAFCYRSYLQVWSIVILLRNSIWFEMTARRASKRLWCCQVRHRLFPVVSSFETKSAVYCWHSTATCWRLTVHAHGSRKHSIDFQRNPSYNLSHFILLQSSLVILKWRTALMLLTFENKSIHDIMGKSKQEQNKTKMCATLAGKYFSFASHFLTSTCRRSIPYHFKAMAMCATEPNKERNQLKQIAIKCNSG